jgi:aspartyl protease family protein
MSLQEPWLAGMASRHTRLQKRAGNGLFAWVFATGLVSVANLAAAQSVTLAGMLGGKALVIVDGGPPKTLGVGETHRGVKLVATQGDNATFDIAGKKLSTRVGDSPASVGGAVGANGGAVPSGDRIVMTAGSGGHFLTQGLINGRTVQLIVDTGATVVSLGVEDAERIGLKYKAGVPIRMVTANGSANGWRVKLDSMRVGDVDVYNVDALVTSGSMPFVLLGNSFLTRFQMTRTSDQMVLVKRY